MTLKPMPPGYRWIETVTPGPVFLVDLASRMIGDREERVAVKRVAPRFAEDRIALAQIAIEAAILHQLDGRRAPRCIESAPDYLVTAWLARDEAPITPAHVTDAFEALAEVHAAGVIHGDLHAGNLLLEDFTQRVMFVDFSLGALGEVAPTADLGEARGHHFTMAPEVARGAPATQASDVFALAAGLATLAFGVVLREPLHPAAMIANAGSNAPDLTRLEEEARRAGGDAAFLALSAALAFDALARPSARELVRISRAG